MPLIKRQQIFEQLAATCPPEAVEATFLEAVRMAGVPSKKLYRPEEVSALGRVLMARAQALEATVDLGEPGVAPSVPAAPLAPVAPSAPKGSAQ